MKMRVVISVLLLLLILTGCTGKREINDLALVMAVGIDKPKEESGDKVELSIEVARAADARGQTGAPAGNTGDPIWSVSATGETLFETIRNLSNVSTRRVFWAHNFIIVVNEEVAKEGIADILDFFTRNPELRMRTWIVITPDKAKDIISTMTGLEVIPGEALDKLFRYTTVSSVAPQSELLDVQRAYLSETTQPVIARMELINRGISNKKAGQAGSHEQVQLKGAGVFKDDKLIGTLNSDETRGLLPFIEDARGGVLPISCPEDPNKMTSVEVFYQRFALNPKYEGGQPSFTVNLDAYLHLTEAGCPISIKDEKVIKELEKETEEKIKSDIEKVLHKAQGEYKVDFLEMGRVFKNKFPAEWKALKDNWESTFPNVKVDITVNANIKSGVLLYEPTRSGKD
ncbi:Ger(x)C family spore germination protein [Bacillus sp. Marseille-P3661]|uniref:Ger(x)C family spore germination protein n=1 Tax=Bacillus sp. Marseille-P3661 TaxID=1936234 RepID=UPI000C82E461|nr:Ger(x)C family spore germination protein [Bacillus sp. Marseille-P3661]